MNVSLMDNIDISKQIFLIKVVIDYKNLYKTPITEKESHSHPNIGRVLGEYTYQEIVSTNEIDEYNVR